MLRLLLLLCLVVVPVPANDSVCEETKTKPGDPATWPEIARLICATILVGIYILIVLVLIFIFIGSICASLPILFPILLVAIMLVGVVTSIMKAF